MPLVMGPNTSGVAASTTALSKEWRYRSTSGSFKIDHYPEAASSDFKKGEVVVISSGSVKHQVPGSAAPAAKAVSAAVTDGDTVLGWALADASGTTGTMIPILIANDDTEALGRIHDAASPSVATDSQLQDVVVGDLAELRRYNDGASIQTVLTAAPSGTAGLNQAVITEKPSAEAATDEYAWVWYKIKAATRALG